MPVTVSKLNTQVLKKQSGWVKIVHDTGQVDAEGKAVTISVTMTQAAIEKEAGVLLPKARVKTIIEAALNEADSQEQEMAAL